MKFLLSYKRLVLMSTLFIIPQVGQADITINAPEFNAQSTNASDNITIDVNGFVNVNGALTAITLDKANKNLIVNDNTLAASKEISSLNGPAIEITTGTNANVDIALNAVVESANNIALFVSGANAGTIATGGTIESKGEFPAAKFAKDYILNNTASGQILSVTGYTGAGVEVSGAGAINGNITNSGVISGKGAGVKVVTNNTGSIVNSGLIQGDLTRTAGIKLETAGIVTGGITNTGNISGLKALDFGPGNTTTVTNSGTLNGDIFLGDGKLIVNPGSKLNGNIAGEIFGSKVEYNPAVNTAFSSSGTLHNLSQVKVNTGTFNLNHNATSIDDFLVNNANLVLNNSIYFTNDPFAFTKKLTLTGTSEAQLLAGSVYGDVKFDAGKVSLLGTGTITGNIKGSNTNASTFMVNIGADKIFASSGNLEQIGLIDVQSGTLRINQPVVNGFALSVQPGAAIEINHNIILDQGSKTLQLIGNAKANVIKSVTVNADYVQLDEGSKTQFTIRSPSDYGQIDLAGKAINMNTKATIEILLGDAYIPSGQSFTLFKNVGALTDNRASLTGSNSLFVSVEKKVNTIGPVSEILAVVTRHNPASFLPVGTGLENVVATLETLLANNQNNDAQLLRFSNALYSSTSSEQLLRLYRSLDAQLNISKVQMMSALSSGVSQRLSNSSIKTALVAMNDTSNDEVSGYSAGSRYRAQMDSYPDKGSYGTWIDGFKNKSYQKDRKTIFGNKASSQGVLVGYDAPLSGQVAVGGLGGFMSSDMRYQNLQRDTANIEAVMGGIYGSYDIAYQHSELQMLYSRTITEQIRKLAFDGVTASADYKGYGVFVEASHTLMLPKHNFMFMPKLALSYDLNVQRGYMENGAGAFNLTVKRSSYTQLTPQIGAGALYNHQNCYGLFRPSVNVMVQQEILGRTSKTTSKFAIGGPMFTSTAPIASQTKIDTQLSFEWFSTRHLHAKVEYRHLWMDRYGSNTVNLQTKYVF